MKKLSLLIFAVLAAGATLYSLYRPVAANDPALLAVPVLTARAETRDLPVVLNLSGRAEAYESVTLKSRVDGQVLTVPFTEGQHVKKGQLLVQLDPADFQARLHQAEAGLLKARSDERRYTDLRARGFVSEAQMVDVKAAAEAQAAAAELARLQLSYATIRAPFDGIIGARLVSPGTGVKTNDTALATVNRIRPLQVSFAVPEKYLADLLAARRDGTLKARLAVPGPGGESYQGEVRFLDNGVDRTTGTLQAKVLLDNGNEALLPGQFLNVSLTLKILGQAVTVPTEAIQQGQEGDYVFVVQPDQSVAVRPVTTGSGYQGITAISQGLSPGETVVTEGQLRLVPGARVQPQSAAVPAPDAHGSQPHPQG